MADGTTMLRVKRIVEADPARRYVVVSAPGKRYGGDEKVTDLLYETASDVKERGHVGDAYARVAARFSGIVRELGLRLDISALLKETARKIEEEKSEEFTASRGEYLTARIMAELLGVPFVDARDAVKFRGASLDEEETDRLLKETFSEDEAGSIRTFSRGGSDISGALAARAAGADLYENWTDVSGFLACDPRIVPEAVGIPSLSYRELRELSYMGANVMHSETIFPVREANIPIAIKNTFRPEDPGTLILPASRCKKDGRVVTGIAGKKSFAVILLEKSHMNEEIGFTCRVLEVFARHNISFEHMPSGIDTMSFVIDSAYLKEGVFEQLRDEIREAVSPDRIEIADNIALLAVVGHGMSDNVGTSARLFGCIRDARVNVRMIDQGSSELNIIVGVENDSYERAVRAVYDEFFGR